MCGATTQTEPSPLTPHRQHHPTLITINQLEHFSDDLARHARLGSNFNQTLKKTIDRPSYS
jgi:hypothetical protein